MSSIRSETTAMHSPSQDYFQMMFEGADMFASVWQPLLKSVGRWQLEVAGLGMKQGQAAISWSHDVARSWTPADAIAANVRYCEAVSSQYVQSSQRLAATVTRATQLPLLSEVVPLPVQRGHDQIVLPGPAEDHTDTRKVA